ncbi:MAG: hypothetical protein DRJ42_17935 [Deltaproteobacteria bacterium]|nr:MAG: hypothetical protein DRJ42_17935 [Deltaproteobacteria bacterium]
MLVAASASCAEGGDEPVTAAPIRVDLRSDYVAGVEFTTIRATAEGSSPIERSVSFGETFADWTRVASFESALGAVRVELIDAAGGVVAAREAAPATGRTSVRIAILRCEACACTSPEDCPVLPTCTAATCDLGACFYEADHGMCPSGVCDPSEGCSATIPDGDSDGVPATEDCDDGDPAVGRDATRGCEDACGTGTEMCASGAWSACEVTCTCEPGTVVTETCGNCGTQVNTCGTDGTFTMGGCVGEGTCAAGEIEQGGACGQCGTLQRTCGASCGWSDFECVEPSAGCWLWNWSAGSGWTAFVRPVASTADAPTEAVVAAFDVEAAGEAYLLTAARYHVMRIRDRTWITSGTLASLFPDLTGVPHAAGSIPADHPMPTTDGTEGLQVHTSTNLTFVYSNVAGTRTWTSSREPVPCCGPAWTGPDAPAFLNVRAAWLDANNQHGWFDADPATLCMGAEGRVYDIPYFSLLEGADAHLLEAGVCFAFAPQRTAATFGPFADAGGPGVNDITAAFYRETDQELWVLTP